MTDFQLMSPAELRGFAREKKIDTSAIDSRKKRQLVALLDAWEAGETYEPSASDHAAAAEEPIEPAADMGGLIDDTPPVGFQTGEPYPEGGEPVDLGEDAPAQVEPEDELRGYPDEVADFVQGSKSLEVLTVEDLVGNNNRVRAHVNSFPMTVDGQPDCKFMIVEVPGEEGTKAAVWWINSAREPVVVDGPLRVVSEYTDSSTRRHHFVDENGNDHEYYPSGGCSTCGRRLANWKPWSNPTRIVQVSRRARREPRHKKTRRSR